MDPAQIPIRDLHLPAEVAWWPPAPGWWALLALTLVFLLLLFRFLYRRFSKNGARRFALRQVAAAQADYEKDRDLVRLATRLSELLRRTMLAYAPRSEVAGLAGERWLEWLDTGLDQPLFTRGSGNELLNLPYRNPQGDFSDVNVDALVGAVRHRIRTPLRSDA